MRDIRKRFNLIGFDRYKIDNKTYRHCSIHPYKRLIESKTDPGLLFCPECGSEYPLKDTIKEQDVLTDVPPNNSNSGPKIISTRKKRKYYDSFGSLIPEDDVITISDMKGGKRVVYYHEQKVEQEEKYR